MDRSEEYAFDQLFILYRYQAKARGFIFELTKEQFKQLTQGLCFYCGALPSCAYKKRKGVYRFNGIDRVDSTQGYTLNNCVSCCKTHNRMKFRMTLKEFVAACRSVVQYMDALSGVS